MASVLENQLLPQLELRRERLQTMIAATPGEAQLVRLLSEVDAALDRAAAGTFGICETCHDPVEPERLIANPLLRFCLDHLTAPEQRALEQDLTLAARIQRGLLPPAEIAAAGWEVRYHWEPAGPVSGDYCDVIAGGNGHGAAGLTFVFGDISGKGVAAAMLMSHLHATFRSLLGVTECAAELVGRANRVFRDSALSPHFATLVCGRALPGGEVELCNAGHLPPRLLTGGGLQAISTTGLPVGAFYSTDFASLRVALAPGDTLVLYTDGLTEARDESGREYGEERLDTVLRHCGQAPAAELIAACRADLAAHLGGARLTDDLTLLALRRCG
jgi:sigma-B regulation protein RsbU (phosphoserine phosphatase)